MSCPRDSRGIISVHRNLPEGLGYESATRLLHDLSELRIPCSIDALSSTSGGPQRNELRVSIVTLRTRMGLHSGVGLPRRPGGTGHRYSTTGIDCPATATGQNDTDATASANISTTSTSPTADAIGRSHRRLRTTAISASSARVELGTNRAAASPAIGPQRVRLVTADSRREMPTKQSPDLTGATFNRFPP